MQPTTKQENKATTPGEWIVTTQKIKGKSERNSHICVVVAGTKKVIAITGIEGKPNENEAIANAALISIAPGMLEALILIQHAALMQIAAPNVDVMNPNAINEMISDLLAKLANEAGEEI
jgi:hypothetical protein